MPFLPFILILAWQVVSRSASFALGWATSLYFGQVPGRQGPILSVISLVAAGWLIVTIGFGVPIFAGALLESGGVIGENFDVEAIHYVGLTAAIILAPPLVAAATVWARFHEERSIGAWLRLAPLSYPATAMLGVSVLQMLVLSPILLLHRWRRKLTLVQVPMVMRKGTDDEDLVSGVRGALASIGLNDVQVAEATGPKSWPLRTVGFASRHLLGAVVRGEPMRLKVDALEIFAFATNVSILGPNDEAHRVRAALDRELAFRNAYLTWNEEAQGFEDELVAVHDAKNGDADGMHRTLDEIQARVDSASLNSEEWNVLYRLRLQLEHEVLHDHAERK